MNKQTLIAVVISTLILIAWFEIQSRLSPSSTQNADTSPNIVSEETIPTPSIVSVAEDDLTPSQNIVSNTVSNTADDTNATPEAQEIVINTNIYRIVMSSKNGTIRSMRMHDKNIQDIAQDTAVELFPSGDKDLVFRILWGDEQEFINTTLPDVYYNVSRPSSETIEFFKNFKTVDGKVFEARKIYTIKEDENLIELTIQLTNSDNSLLQIGNEYAYSLSFGPQLGPLAEIIDTQKSKQVSRRRFLGNKGKKIQTIGVRNNRSVTKNDLYKWIGISGRYISMLVLTGSTSYTTVFSAQSTEGLNSGAQFLLRRPKIQSSAIADTYRIYIGPNVRNSLKRYNDLETNAFNISNADFDKLTPSRLLTIIERPLYALLKFIYRIIPNFGVAIIILTLIMRLLTFPVIRKSKANGEKMKALSPKIQKLRAQYSDDPMRMNQEMMSLYKREKISPFSSIVPMLIQIPFFISMYRVISESVDLWRSPFVGWITDLSSADQLISFGDFSLPILGWTSLNLLPIIMLGTQYVSSFIMSKQQDTSAAGSARLMFIMSYVFPFMIFFALYNSPSGLILYWVCSNVFTVLTMVNWKKKPVQEPKQGLTRKEKSKINI